MTVLVPNSDEETRRRVPPPGDRARLGWRGESIHIVRNAAGGEPAETEPTEQAKASTVTPA
jgi:hypothetical protein